MRKSKGQLEREERKKYYGMPVGGLGINQDNIQIIRNPNSLKQQRKQQRKQHG